MAGYNFNMTERPNVRRILDDGIRFTRVSQDKYSLILNTLSGSFSSCWLTALQRSYFLLACSNVPVALAHPQLEMEHPEVANDFRSADYGPDELPYTLLSTHVLDFVGDKSAPINTLDRPELEFEMARSREWGFPDFLKRVRDGLSYEEVTSALAPMGHFDQLEHLLYWTDRFGHSQLSDRWLGM